MYESFFGLRQRPFAAAGIVSRYVAVPGLEQTRRTLARCIEREEGPALVIGPAGTGKTLLCQLLANEFQQRFQPVLLTSGPLTTRRDVLQAILFELGLPYRGLEEGELRLALVDYLTRSPHCPNGILLVVDEAHTLPLKLLEELRMITNVVRGGQPRVRLVLAGAAPLEERLASPKLESFSQRLAARCYLEPLDRKETCDYVRAQIQMAGGDAQQVFAPDAFEAIYKASDGIPRLINQVCDQALLLAAQAGHRGVDASTIEKGWASLQQLPTPWNETAADRAGSSCAAESIEFGNLDEDEPFQEPADGRVHMEQLGRQLDDLGDELVEWGAGATEVELELEDPASEPSELFEINLSLTGQPAAAARPQWHSTEFCDTQADAEPAAEPSLHYEEQFAEGGIVSDHEIVEEVVVDRYATLDALKRQGKLPLPQANAAAATPSAHHSPRGIGAAAAAERSLSVAEALVQHATAMEQAGWVGPAQDVLTSEVAGGSAPGDWSSVVDLLPPAAALAPQPVEQPLDGLTINLQTAEEDFEELPSACLALPIAAAAADNEPDLIVIDDDPPGLQVQVQPQATPVKKQEYRQLFARLRRS